MQEIRGGLDRIEEENKGNEEELHKLQKRHAQIRQVAILNFVEELPPSLRDACREFIRDKAITEHVRRIRKCGTCEEDSVTAEANALAG